MAGRIEVGIMTFSSALPYAKDGRLRAIAMTARTRNPALPDLQTIGETVPGLSMLGWYGILPPKGTSPEMINRINAAVNRAMANPEIEKQVKVLHIDPMPGTPADFAKVWKDDYERLSGLIRELGITPQ